MKVVTAHEMQRIEQLAYSSGQSEEAFMESAGEAVATIARRRMGELHLQPPVALLCGRGNNAGDAFVAGRSLLQGGFEVIAYALAAEENCSPLCKIELARFRQAGGRIVFVKRAEEIVLEGISLLLDGILGTGFHGTVTGLFAEAIELANKAPLFRLAIDVPSGIDASTGGIGGVALQADETVFLGLPKIGCFLGDAWNYTGRVTVRSFGLPNDFVQKAEAKAHLLEEPALPPIIRNRHKYQAGYVVGVGGSPDMPGAPILASFAALRSGAGIVRLLHPEVIRSELVGAPPEIIRQGYAQLETILEAAKRANALFVGPGMGRSDETKRLLSGLLTALDKPLVIDADALYFLADLPVPAGAILTPHHGEMTRLLGSGENLLECSQKYVEKHKVTLILKGAPTWILHPGSMPMLSPFGDPGMATAGSGDVLTGIVAAFLAQGESAKDAARLAVYFHSKAGELAAARYSSYSMVASDITEALPQLFSSCRKRTAVL